MDACRAVYGMRLVVFLVMDGPQRAEHRPVAQERIKSVDTAFAKGISCTHGGDSGELKLDHSDATSC